MLIDFSVKNYTCFNDIAELSMQAASITEHKAFNTYSYGKLDLLKSAIIYGANASGKSKLLQAMKHMKRIVTESSKESLAGSNLPIIPFLLSTNTENQPSIMEIRFITNNTLYRYGFKATPERIMEEWLYSRKRPTAKEAELFVRNMDNIKIGSQYKEGKKIKSLTRNNALFLSVSAQFNLEIAKQILDWFTNFNIVSALRQYYSNFTVQSIAKNDNFKERVLRLLEMADIGIKGLKIIQTPVDKKEIPKNIPERIKREIVEEGASYSRVELGTEHERYDKNKKQTDSIHFDMATMESEGTLQLFSMAGIILDSLDHGKILVIDEFESRLHPKLQKLIIDLFHSPRYNKYNAQLIVATHNTRLLSENIFRRDQIWFVEKNDYGESELYSLYDIKGMDGIKVRNDVAYEKNYILGKYGGVPTLTKLDLEG